ncbi:hypothetical protein [Rhizobium tibeticum]|uniref:hypothetical protein n=1 Tax=Rhizobium tibeticum TaxID=501024 RepID=UPI000A6A6FE0|nr:hypothetical protein [Rhizobium tibeticum]
MKRPQAQATWSPVFNPPKKGRLSILETGRVRPIGNGRYKSMPLICVEHFPGRSPRVKAEIAQGPTSSKGSPV